MRTANRRHPQNGYRMALAPYSLWSALFVVVPLAFIAYYAFTDNQFAFTTENVARFFTKELAGDAPGDIKVNAVKILSKQLEYCEENMAMIETALDE